VPTTAAGTAARRPEKIAAGLLTLRKSVIRFRPADVACGNE
jgi:hypothetical protein